MNKKKTYKLQLPKDVNVDNAHLRIHDGQIVVDVEFKYAFRPKFGDIVKIVCGRSKLDESCKRDYMVCIMPDKEIPNELFDNFFFDIANVTMALDISHICAWRREFHLEEASESEKKELFDKLAEIGKKWNPETKQLEDIRWRADKDCTYYYVDERGNVLGCNDTRGCASDSRYSCGNYFKTREAARPYSYQIKEIFKKSKAE